MKRLAKTSRSKTRIKISFMKGFSVILILAMLTILLYGYIIDELKDAEKVTIKALQNDRFDHLYNYMEILRDDAYKQAKRVSTSIENDIKMNMDMEDLKNDLDNGVFNDQLYNIIRANIEDVSLNGTNNYKNGIIIMTSKGVYEDLSYNRASDDKSALRDWTYETKHSYNPELESDAIYKLLNHSDDLIITEPTNFINEDVLPNHKKIKHVSYDILKDIYLSEGLEGFKNYQIYVPVYITDDGDIFGQDDIVQGIKQNTHKIIVIQEFNLYDQIENNSKDLYWDLQSDNSSLSSEFRYILTILYFLGICYALALVGVVLVYTKKYNDFIDRHEREENENS